jgi:hypothetical protein
LPPRRTRLLVFYMESLKERCARRLARASEDQFGDQQLAVWYHSLLKTRTQDWWVHVGVCHRHQTVDLTVPFLHCARTMFLGDQASIHWQRKRMKHKRTVASEKWENCQQGDQANPRAGSYKASSGVRSSTRLRKTSDRTLWRCGPLPKLTAHCRMPYIARQRFCHMST